MVTKLLTVYDSKSETYLNPFVMKNKGEALRSFQDIVNDPSTQYNKHPADFTLFEIGEYDDLSGVMRPYEAKISLGLALDFIKP